MVIVINKLMQYLISDSNVILDHIDIDQFIESS